MKYLAFILAVQFSVLATQPAWQPLGQLFDTNVCSQICTVSLDDAPTGTSDENNTANCYLPFQCCFTCCCFCNRIGQLSLEVATAEKSRPSEITDILHSQSFDIPGQPPECCLPA